MNIKDLTIKESRGINSGMIGKYVIARCTRAGVHAGILVAQSGQECVLKEARRLYYWKPANKASFLSGIATEGLHADSKIGAPVKEHLLEVCELIQCTNKAAKSISKIKSHVQ